MVDILSNLKSFAQTAAEGIPNTYIPVEDLEDEIATLSSNATIGAAIGLLVLIIIAALTRDRLPKLKLPLFILIAFTMVSSFLFLAGATIYLNVKSETGGPVHWHADFEVWACGNELELRDPYEFLSNKIGTATLHEHDDRRIHLEGVPVETEVDATLGKFMYVIGGAVTDKALVVPLNPPETGSYFENDHDGDGLTDLNASQIDPFIIEDEHGPVARFIEGQSCGDQESVVNVFRYRVNQEDNTYYQEKLDNPRDYVIRDESVVPNGDCIIFEFGPDRDKTDKLCPQYGIADIDRCAEFGVTEEVRDICIMREVDPPSKDQSAKTSTGGTDEAIACYWQTAGINPEGEDTEAKFLCEDESGATTVITLPEWPYEVASLSAGQLALLRDNCQNKAAQEVGLSAECFALDEYDAGNPEILDVPHNESDGDQ